MDEAVVLADSMINEVDGDVDRALSVARCIQGSIDDVVAELERRTQEDGSI